MRRRSIEKTRGGIVGANSHLFVPRSYPDGARGQYVLSSFDFISIADPRDLANSNGLGGQYGVPDFLWVAGDGNTPTIGPTLTLTGTPSVIDGPYQVKNGDSVEIEEYDGTENRITTTAIDPALTDDIIIFGGFRAMREQHAAPIVRSIFSSSTYGATGIFVGFNTASLNYNVRLKASLNFLAGVIYASLSIFIVIIDRDGNFEIRTPGANSGLVATPGGSLASGLGWALADEPGGTRKLECGIEFCGFYFGSGLYEKWSASGYALCGDFFSYFSGINPIQGERGSFTRASAAAWKNRNGIWSIASSGFPRAGDSEGLLLEPSRQNDCYNTVNPSVTTGWSVTGGTHTAGIDDSTALAAADIGVFGNDVHRFVPGGADQIIYGGAQTGNVNSRCITIGIRGSVGGESVDIGFRDVSAGTFQNTQTVVLTTAYQLVTIENITPSDTDLQFGLDCDAGDTIYFIASHSEEGAVPTSIIPNWSTIAAAVRAMDDFVLAETPSSTEGAIEIDVEPVGWGGTDAGISPLLWTTAAGTAMLYVNAAGRWECDIDGTTQLDSGVSPVDGVRNVIKLRWNTGGLMSIDVDGTVVTGAYDGSLLAGGTWELAAGAPFKVRSFKTMRNG